MERERTAAEKRALLVKEPEIDIFAQVRQLTIWNELARALEVREERDRETVDIKS